MKKVSRLIFGCLVMQAFSSLSGSLLAQSASPDTISWSWEVTSTTSTHSKSCTIAFADNLLINWGDGVTEWIPDSMSTKTITHVYDAQANYSCTATGVGISYFKADSKRLLSLETRKAPNLTYLSCTSGQIASLDLSHNLYLVSLYCGGNDLSSLYLAFNRQLQTLTCSDNKLKTLDISMLPFLKKVTTHTNELTSIKVSSTGALNYLSCTGCNLSSEALDSIFTDLPSLSVASASKNLYVLDNPGSSSCHPEIAVAKNWTIDRVITQSTFYIPSVSCRMNDYVKVAVNLKNVAPAIAFEMDILIPDGFVLDSSKTCLASSRMGQHLLSLEKTSTTSSLYKIMVYSLKSKDVFSGTDGTVLQLYLKAPSVMKTYTFDITNAILIDTLTNVMDLSVTDGLITVKAAALMGDVNGDEKVNVTDIVNLVAWINGKKPSGFVSDAADMDGNGIWNVADIAKIVEVINSQGNSGSSSSVPSRSRITGRSLSLYNSETIREGNHMYLMQSGKNSSVLELCMTNSDTVQAFQVDITLPQSLNFKPVANVCNTARSKNHVFSLEKINDLENKWRLISYSLRPNQPYADSTGAVALFEIENFDKIKAGVYNIYLDNQVVTSMDLNESNVSIYDAQLEVEQTSLTDGFQIFSGKGILDIAGNGLRSISIRDIFGRSVGEISPSGNITEVNLLSGVYMVSTILSDGSLVIRKVLVL